MSSVGMPAFFRILDERRRELGMTFAALSKRSGVSRPTVVRILSGKHGAASLASVAAIADALGLDLHLGTKVAVKQFREQQARKKARRLVGMLQGTSGLEGQGLDAATLDRMTDRTARDLLAGPPRRLWDDWECPD
jgi:transcriptional regulator with XRE-family HTH domain